MNLLSVRTLDQRGFENRFRDSTLKMLKGVMVVAHRQLCGSLHITRVKINLESMNVVEQESQDLWHQRLGHMSEKGLSTLMKKKLITIKDTMSHPCNHCLFGKQRKFFFSSSSV